MECVFRLVLLVLGGFFINGVIEEFVVVLVFVVFFMIFVLEVMIGVVFIGLFGDFMCMLFDLFFCVYVLMC